MKTLFLYDKCGEDRPTFLELEGDYSRFNDVYINQSLPELPDESDASYEARLKAHKDLCYELNELLFDSNTGKLKHTEYHEPTKDWDFFVCCGFIL